MSPKTEVSEEMIKNEFPGFSSKIVKRLFAGAKAYGDASFDKSVIELLNEVEEEILDICGWSFILYCKIQYLKGKITWPT